MFTPSRLTLARKRRGLTKTRLAKDVGVTVRSITAYEAGDTVPTDETVDNLSRVLRFPPSFFGAGDIEAPPPEGVSFRAMKSMTAAKRDAALGAGALAMELSAWIDGRFSLPEPDLPDLAGNDPEAAASALRSAWDLGERPVRNMVHLLEAHGIRVFSLSEECRELDAFSFWWNGLPYVFLNTQKSAERSRLDAAHELGHLVLHRSDLPRSRDIEREAQQFGGAFLMPRGSVLASVSGLVTVGRLIKLKRNWNVAVTALTYRLHELGLLSDWQYRSLFTELSARGYRKAEPEPIERETSQVLAKVFAALREEGVDKRAIARDLHVTADEINALIFGLAMVPLTGGASPRARVPRNPGLQLVPPKKGR